MPAMTKLLASVLGRGAVTVLLVRLVGCQGGAASRESAPAVAPSSASPPGGSLILRGLPLSPLLPGDNDPAPASPAPLPENLSLGDQLVHEASSRPAGAARSEDLVAAVEAKGIKLARTRQVLGKTLHARYCAIAVTVTGLVASVCEFDSASAALAAAKDSEQRFGKAIPDRRFVTNGNSLLTIANLTDSAGAEAQTIAASFAALKTI
jgi:hypothetical protein